MSTHGFVALISVAALFSSMAPAATPTLVLVDRHPAPVITTRSPGAAGIKYGFEGGRVVKVGRTYHLFTSEMSGDPVWVRMKLAHWRSDDKLHWTRVATLFESSAEFEGKDPRAALWSPLPVYDDGERRWNLFYVAYRAAPNTSTQFRMNHEGRIWRAVSAAPGPNGISGPYRDEGVVLEPGPASEPWEGLQGTDSFFPYRVGQEWYALYGSANTEKVPIEHWRVGVASAPSIAGPWRRHPDLNPAPIEPVFIENPIVTRLRDDRYIAVYDTTSDPDAIGYSISTDGINWPAGKSLMLQTTKGAWSPEIRTPLGLVPEDDGTFTVFYTGFEQKPDWSSLMESKPVNTFAIGFARVKIVD
jgi:hypothetical protein